MKLEIVLALFLVAIAVHVNARPAPDGHHDCCHHDCCHHGCHHDDHCCHHDHHDCCHHDCHHCCHHCGHHHDHHHECCHHHDHDHHHGCCHHHDHCHHHGCCGHHIKGEEDKPEPAEAKESKVTKKHQAASEDTAAPAAAAPAAAAPVAGQNPAPAATTTQGDSEETPEETPAPEGENADDNADTGDKDDTEANDGVAASGDVADAAQVTSDEKTPSVETAENQAAPSAEKAKTKSDDDNAKQYLSTANAAMDVAAEAVVDAEDLHTMSFKKDASKSDPNGKYLQAAKGAVDAAHKALSKASEIAGFGKLPAPKYVALKSTKNTKKDLGEQYTEAAGTAVNVAEKAMDNLAAMGYPNIVPSVADNTAALKEDGRAATETTSSAKKENVQEGEFIEDANKAIDRAHEALEKVTKKSA